MKIGAVLFKKYIYTHFACSILRAQYTNYFNFSIYNNISLHNYLKKKSVFRVDGILRSYNNKEVPWSTNNSKIKNKNLYLYIYQLKLIVKNMSEKALSLVDLNRNYTFIFHFIFFFLINFIFF